MENEFAELEHFKPLFEDEGPDYSLAGQNRIREGIVAKLVDSLAVDPVFCDTGIHAGEWRVSFWSAYLTDEEKRFLKL